MRRDFAWRLLLLAPLLAGCSEITNTTATLWEGALAPVAPASVSGQVAVVSQFGGIQASLELRGALPEVTYRWRLAEGSCSAPGRVIGGEALYPVIRVGDETGAQSATTLPGQMTSGRSYVALAFRVLANGAEQPAACGPLVER